MKAIARLLFASAFAAILLSTPASEVKAAPGSDIWTHYYDCSLAIVGEKFRGCDSSGYNWGVLAGYYKEIESCSCEGTTCVSTWYQWSGSAWVNIGHTAPGPAC